MIVALGTGVDRTWDSELFGLDDPDAELVPSDNNTIVPDRGAVLVLVLVNLVVVHCAPAAATVTTLRLSSIFSCRRKRL